MLKTAILSSLGALLSTLALAAPLDDVNPRQTACEFDSATAPECWGSYSLSTNWYEDSPDTGVIREYWFEVTNTTGAPDGVDRIILAINGSVPGPTIIADWGDTVVVHVSNALANNGTSIHFHGIRQFENSLNDGVASITQCPAAPGDSITYTWKATQYGTSWYHSHFSLQAWNGVFGGIIINGPASAPYDEDKGTIILNDWYHETSDSQFVLASSGGPPPAQNGLINGTNTYDTLGARFETTVTSGSSYRLRIVNVAMDTFFKFSIDNHTFTVISADLVPIVPFTTEWISIGIGQRYDVIVNANQTDGNYWIRSIPQTACSSTNENTLNILGIFNYDTVTVADPDTSMWAYNDSCADIDASNLVPYVALNPGDDDIEDTFDVGLTAVDGLFRWTINDNIFLSDWGNPTLQQVVDGATNFTAEQNVNVFDEANNWVYFVIESAVALTHPIHLHGHDFFILAQGLSGTYADGDPLNTVNPPRRDVAMLPAGGYLVIAWETDNPGVWLLHCHIGWHTSQGLALQNVERASEIAATTDVDSLNQTCVNWNQYASAVNLVQFDSGI